MLARPQAFVCLAHFEIRPLLSSRSVTTGHLKTYAKFHRPARNSRSQRQHRRRTGLGCIAHAGHNHSHGDTSDVPCQVQETDHSHDDGSPCCSSVIGHSHGNHDDPLNPIHRILTAILNITGASKVVPWLADSVPSSVAKILLFALAAWAAWAAGCAAAASTAQALRQVSALATAGVYFFAGVPAAVDLSYDLSALRVDTHVLMHLAVVGTLVTGLPLEGALLLVLFQTSHAVEHLLTARAQGSLKALYASVPDHADLVSLGPDGAPALDSVRRVLAADVTIGDVMLIKPGGQVKRSTPFGAPVSCDTHQVLIELLLCCRFLWME